MFNIYIEPVMDEFQGTPFVYYEVSSSFSDEVTITQDWNRANEIAEEIAQEHLNENNYSR
jgi:hypothetical protein|tara:strand:+ start:299 stop:478 length:180 start_codon:yes stop_codon:yes gene_type:complete